MAGALRGRADVDDSLQQAYLRLINEYERWPERQSAAERAAYAYRTIHFAAKDAIRQAAGRSDRAPRPREVPVDFSHDARESAEGWAADPTQLLAQQLLVDLAGRHPGDDEHLDRALYVAALGALEPLEHQIVTQTRVAGYDNKELANRLGLSHQQVRTLNSEARQLLMSLLACARGRDIREAQELDLFAYLEGRKLSRQQRRLVKRHLQHCDNCQQIAALHSDLDRVAAGLALPLPLLAAIPGGLAGLLNGTHANSGAPLGRHAASALRRTLPRLARSGSRRGRILNSLTGKAALLTVAAGATAQLTHSHHGQTAPAAAPDPPAVRAASRPATPPLRKAILIGSRPSRRTAEPRRARHHTKHRPRPATARTPAARAQPRAPATTAAPPSSTPPAPAPKAPANGPGGEFVLGTH